MTKFYCDRCGNEIGTRDFRLGDRKRIDITHHKIADMNEVCERCHGALVDAIAKWSDRSKNG